jgi:hypothetical protein
MNSGEKEWFGMDWIDLAQDRNRWRALMEKVMNFWVQLNAGNFLSSCITGDISRS